ncbi:hypothetical protein [Natrinema pallidum]|uniref:Uncharacterized protein n=1 Tax=Natrinema pallidum TaxID=69527 RepID=A0A4V1IFK1_9EURY|nr:hypothetical protein [Natrinema pallidum]QCW05274.1 hypothetical protein FGF80_18700 [Natrinema pallidum]
MVNPNTIPDGRYTNLYCPECQAHPNNIETHRERDGWYSLRHPYCKSSLNAVVDDADEPVSTHRPPDDTFDERLFETDEPAYPTDANGRPVAQILPIGPLPIAPAYRCRDCGRETPGPGYGYPRCWDCGSEDFETVALERGRLSPIQGQACRHVWLQYLLEPPSLHTCPVCETQQNTRVARIVNRDD